MYVRQLLLNICGKKNAKFPKRYQFEVVTVKIESKNS